MEAFSHVQDFLEILFIENGGDLEATADLEKCPIHTKWHKVIVCLSAPDEERQVFYYRYLDQSPAFLMFVWYH